jgi:uncharacterized membrane protein
VTSEERALYIDLCDMAAAALLAGIIYVVARGFGVSDQAASVAYMVWTVIFYRMFRECQP